MSHRRRRWGGGTGPPLGFKVSIARQNFGQFYMFWAILSVKTFFFWRTPKFGQENRLKTSLTESSHISGKSLEPPKSF